MGEIFLSIAKNICNNRTYKVFEAIFKYETGLILIKMKRTNQHIFKTRFNLSKLSDYFNSQDADEAYINNNEFTVIMTRSLDNKVEISIK